MSEHPKHDWSHALVDGKKLQRCNGCRNYSDDPHFDQTGPCARIVEIGNYRLVIQLMNPAQAGKPEATDKVLSVHVSHTDGTLPEAFVDATHDDLLGRHEQWLQLYTRE